MDLRTIEMDQFIVGAKVNTASAATFQFAFIRELSLLVAIELIAETRVAEFEDRKLTLTSATVLHTACHPQAPGTFQ